MSPQITPAGTPFLPPRILYPPYNLLPLPPSPQPTNQTTTPSSSSSTSSTPEFIFNMNSSST